LDSKNLAVQPEPLSQLAKHSAPARNGRTIVSFFILFYTQSPLLPANAGQLEEILSNYEKLKEP
jgi:hypothetical protein